ncbi:hypothetical protein PGIGA_G00018690 [Pangasianodon gigas]|uniref:Uncharacterized protein n=1 Tax=Pangasianodon gigas TaxID=30993 RepID=A0ACC5WVI7_PANGG|nr:hypothetical protein [Pangasianodon gigas]
MLPSFLFTCSEIPKVSLCPPDSEDAESPMNEVPIEGDHINHLSTPPSSTQLYDQVLQSHAYQSPRLKRCPCCNHQQPITDNVCLNQTNASSHSDCTSNAVKTVNKNSPFHQPTCQNTMQCHWLQGSRDGSNYKPVQHHVVTVRTERLHRIPKNYSQVIVEYPMTVLISCAVVLLAFSLAGILIGPLPDFSDPLAGFEPRGTDIGIRLAAWAKLQESTGPGKALSPTSKQFEDQSIAREVTSKTQQHLRHRSRRMLHTDTTENAYFCNDPGDRYAQLVFRSGNSDSLWSLKAIYSMCEMEQTQIRSDAHFKELCQVKSKSEAVGNKGKGECCPSWSLGNFLALLNNISSCFSLTAQQVSDSLSLLRYCAPYYHDGSLVASCAERSKYGYCASVPHSCKHSSIIYQILHYLVDKDFLGPQTVEYQVPSLKYSVLFLPMAKGNALMEIYLKHLEVLAAGGIYISCVDPGMKLPSSDSRATQLFRSSHPFERYDAEYRHQFMFERMKQGEDKPMTMTLIWGVTPANGDDRFNPRSNGSFTMDPEFNMSSSEAQVWLRRLCGKIRNQSFYSTSPADQEAVEDNTCFVEDLIHWVSIRRCSENEDAFSFCCNNITFPYPPSVFERCLKMMTEERQAETGSARNGGLRFDSQNRIAALVVVFKTSQNYSFNFSRTSNFYKQIMSWFNNEISSAPPGLQRGWFVSQLLLYDLQQCLSSETLVVAGFSVALTFASLLLTTWNIPLSIFVTFAVGGSVFVTVGLLVLLEWQLNSVEALFISAAAGLSVDFAANYCISYCLAPHTDRLGRVAYSLKKMGCPVATGAGAYFCVGIIMLPATALLFRKLGIFLLLVKCVACGFATFFFQSLCCFFGPEKNCGKIIIPCAKERATENIPPSCSGAEAGNNNPSANGTFSCGTGTGSQGRRNCNKEGGGAFLCPNQHRHRQHQSRLGREPEQYELQPLACHLSDSFENSTCTSKLSNRPSVLSDDIEFCGLSPKGYYDRISTESVSEEICSRHLKGCDNPQAVQTSSPYKGNKTRPVVVPPGDLAKEKRLCKKCHSGPGIKLWNISLSSSSMEDITVTETTDDTNKRSLSMDGAYRCHAHKRLLSCQSQSSIEGLEDSNETCLSDIEPAVSIAPPTVTEGELRPGHLNGKRDTLRLSLRETVYDPGSPGSGRGRTSQSELPVILPNSQPDLPDVWIKRDGRGEDSS